MKTKPAKQLRGLQKVCKLYGRMEIGGVMWCWDYANDVAVKEKNMKIGSDRWKKSEAAKYGF